MRTIEVRTTQNVTISYELAPARDRILAFIIDMMIKAGVYYVLMILFFTVGSDIDPDVGELLIYLVVVPILMTPMLLMEVFMNGQTLGKKALKIKVIKLNGKQPVFYDYLLRWCFRLVDVYGTLGISGSILVASTDYAQRLGDMVTNTTVVKVSTRLPITLNDVLSIDDRLKYEPTYLEVRNFREEDIMLIKSSLERYQKYKNEAHRKAILEICERLGEKLGIVELPDDRIRFLRTVIKDYIVLTR